MEGGGICLSLGHQCRSSGLCRTLSPRVTGHGVVIFYVETIRRCGGLLFSVVQSQVNDSVSERSWDKLAWSMLLVEYDTL